MKKNKPTKRIFGLVPNVFFLGLVSLFNDFSSEMVYSVMPAFLTVTLGAPAVFVGFMEGFADALASLLKIFSGWFSDRLGKRKSIVVSGYSLSVLTRLFLTQVLGFWQVFALRMTDRVGKGLRDAPRDALIAQSVDGHEVGKSFGYHRAMDTIGSVMGPLAAVILLPMLANNYRQLFLIAFFAGLLAVITFIFVKDIKTEPVRNRPAINMFSLKQFNSPFKHYISAVFIFGLGLMPISLMLLKSQATALGSFGIPVVYLISSASFILFAIPFGKLSDKVGERKILVGGFVVAIIAYAIFALTTNVIGMIVGFIIFGIYSAMTDGIMRSLASKLVSRDQLATGQGFLNAAVGISSLLAGIIGGAIWTFWGPAAAFFYGILMMAVGLLVFLSLNGVKKELQLE